MAASAPAAQQARMAVDVVSACAAASDTSGVPGLAVVLAVLFAALLASDSLLASRVIQRKAAEAEEASRARMKAEEASRARMTAAPAIAPARA